nr:MAG TPA: Sporulation protein Cse60 [Caudoviricetes sp.]
MKVKIIQASGYRSLQNEVNDWLKSFKGHIVNMSIGTLNGSLSSSFYMAILYKE